MQLKLLIIPVMNQVPAEAKRNVFLRGHRVLVVKKEFVPDSENSFWAFCAECLDGTPAPATTLPGRGPKVDYREILSDADFAVLSKLREWRKAVAEKETIPVYAVLSNEQLAGIVQRKAALKEIEGVGEAKAEKSGDARYTDDFVLWSNDGAFLRRVWRENETFLETVLKLRLKSGASLNRTRRGMDFLGCRLFPHQTRLSRRSQRHVEPLLASVRGADATAFRRAVLRRSWGATIGPQPRHTRWPLEQRCQQLHVVRLQQQPVQPQQQLRFPGCRRPSSPPRPLGRGAEPVAILSSKCADTAACLSDRQVRAPLAKTPVPLVPVAPSNTPDGRSSESQPQLPSTPRRLNYETSSL